MEIFTLVGIRTIKFDGSDGKPVSGVNLYFTYEHEECEGVCTDRIFLSDAKFGKISFVPGIGGRFQIVYNRYGKVADVVAV